MFNMSRSKKTKVVLVAPKADKIGGADIEPIKTPLTGLLTLGTILKKNGFEVVFYDETISSPNYEKLDPDFLLISAMSATAKRAYEIADKFTEKNTKVILGGLHPTNRPKEALEHADQVVKGEGEKVIVDIVEKKLEQKIIEGKQVEDLDSIPFPDFSLAKNYPDKPDKVSLSTSRGCPYGCNFCSINDMFGSKIRYASNEEIVEYLSRLDGIETLCFDEPNFIANKKRAIDLLQKMKKRGIEPKRTWISTSLDVAKHQDFLKLCSELSDFNFTIGLESINQKSQEQFSPNKTNSVNKMKEYLSKIHDYGIKIEGSFIFGSDQDNKETFDKTLEFCKETKIDFPAFFPLTPYPGTKIREKLEKQDRIFTDNWNYYDNLHTVYYPQNMTPYELQKEVISLYKRYYSIKKGIKHLLEAQFFYSGVTFYLKYLFWKMIRENKEFLGNLKDLSKDN